MVRLSRIRSTAPRPTRRPSSVDSAGKPGITTTTTLVLLVMIVCWVPAAEAWLVPSAIMVGMSRIAQFSIGFGTFNLIDSPQRAMKQWSASAANIDDSTDSTRARRAVQGHGVPSYATLINVSHEANCELAQPTEPPRPAASCNPS